MQTDRILAAASISLQFRDRFVLERRDEENGLDDDDMYVCK